MVPDNADPHEVGEFCTDFTIAGAIGDPHSIDTLRRGLLEHPTKTINVSGEEFLKTVGAGGLPQRDQSAVLIGLIQTGVAQRIGGGHSILEATYRIDTDRGAEVLTQQLIGAKAIAGETDEPGRRTTVETLATFPKDTEPPANVADAIVNLPPRLRQLLLEAQESVRLANPYFDTTPQIIDDILALPRKGVETRILTREIDHPDHHAVFGRIHDALTPEQEASLEVRELYNEDSAGWQTSATHAKVMVVDDELAYVGSANLTVTSLTSNFEVGVIIEGPAVEHIAAVFDAVFDASSSVTFPR